MKRTTIVEIISVLFIILFLYTALSKLMEYSVFKEQIAVSPFLAPVASLVAPMIPIIEILLVLMLIVPKWRLKGLFASTALMVAFTVYIIAMMLFAENLPCSCGGVLAELSWGQHIIFNSVFIVLGMVGIILEKKIRKEADDQWSLIGKRTFLQRLRI
jgi:uncharacterized membrane protein YphA (DoxX/SURF4 family)